MGARTHNAVYLVVNPEYFPWSCLTSRDREVVMRSKYAAFAFALMVVLAVQPAGAEDRDLVLSSRVGIPTDTLVNIEDLYHWGVALELGLAVQVNRWFAAGGLAGYGFSLGKPPLVPEYKHQVHAAARLAFGNLDRLSVSLLGGAFVFLEDEVSIYPNIGIGLDYRAFSLGLSAGSVSAGMNFRL
jgi:hypothetical protein